MTLTLRVMTWNVHGTFKVNPRFDIDAVSSIIRKWSPDIVGLQEIDSRGRKDNPFERLAGVVGVHNVDARSIVTADGDYGQVLLSKWPFVRAPTIIDVSYRERDSSGLVLGLCLCRAISRSWEFGGDRMRCSYRLAESAAPLGARPSRRICCGHSAGASRRAATPIPRGNRPSTAAVTRSGVRKAREMVILTCRALQCCRAARLSIVSRPSTIS
jgi:hypothetical protein